MATTMKSNDAAISAMQQLLQERVMAEPALAIKLSNPNKSMSGAVNYLCHQIKKSGLCCVEQSTVVSILLHYFDEEDIKDEGNIGCDIAVAKPELSEEDKEKLKKQAMEQFKQEQLREIRRQSAPNPQPKPTATAPKAAEEINVQPSLFDL